MGLRVGCACSALLLGVATLAVGAPASAARPPPNIVLVILDDVGVELFGAYNQHGAEVVGPAPPEHAVTPNIEALAEAGLLFRNAWSAPLCKPTRATLFTGMYGLHNGVIDNEAFAFDTLQTLPELLASAPVPYVQRVAIGKWHLSAFVPYSEASGPTPTELGFTSWAGAPFGAGYRNYPWAVDPAPPGAALEYPARYRTSKDLAEAVAFVESRPAGPWFLWLALKAAHSPWDEAETPRAASSPCYAIADTTRRVRCRQLEIFDRAFGGLLAALEANDPGLGGTTVILVGDNGSPVRAADAPEPIPGKVNHDGKRSLYEGGLNVPLIVAGAGVAANDPTTIEETPALVQVADVFSTILDLADVAGGTVGVDGVSFASVLAGGTEHRRCVYVDGIEVARGAPPLHPENHDVALRNGRHKLIRHAGAASEDERYELYDLLADPGETTPLPLKGSAFKELRAELNGLDQNPLRSPCALRKRKIDCELGPEFLATAFAIGTYRVRRRRR